MAAFRVLSSDVSLGRSQERRLLETRDKQPLTLTQDRTGQDSSHANVAVSKCIEK